MEILGGKGSFYEDIVTFVDASRDIEFIRRCINIFQASYRQFRTRARYILSHESATLVGNPSSQMCYSRMSPRME